MRPVSHSMRQGHMCPPLDNDPNHNVQVRVMLGLLLKADGVCVSSLANVSILSNHGTLQFFGLLDSLPYDEEVVVWGRRWIVKTFTLGERHGYGVYACEDIILEVQ